MCNENDCKEGLYNLNGICFNCTAGLPNCKKCHSVINEYNKKIYKCDECLSDEYIINTLIIIWLIASRKTKGTNRV